ncbi:MAG: MFS transporter [Alphaproteobacteria bacterium]|nr:MFS transporter [Alphaproteobacteria bacterium]
MSDPASPSQQSAPAPSKGDLVITVVFTTLVMTLASMASLWIPAIAPAVASDLGVSPSLVGYQFTLTYSGAMIASLFAGGMVQRFGAWRTSQASLAALALGHLIIMTGELPLMLVGSVVTGLGYGSMNPPALDLLNRVATAGNRNLVFSIRFTGVPLGGVLASLIGPSMALAVGWHATMLVVGSAGLVLFFAMQPLRARFDANRDPEARVVRDPFTGLKLVMSSLPLRCLAFTGLCFAAVQLSLMSFTVTLLVDEIGWSLVSAGIALSCIQVAGVIGRVGWGVVADRLRSSSLVLMGLGVVMLIGSLVASTLSAAWPGWAVYGFFFAFGLAVVGWNGVFASETARISPPGHVGHVAGGVLFVTFAGVLAGPVVFSSVFQITGTYSATFLLTAVLAGIGMLLIGIVRRAATSSATTSHRSA